MQSELGITGPDYFHYLNQGRCYQVDGIDDRTDFQDTVVCSNSVGSFSSPSIECYECSWHREARPK